MDKVVDILKEVRDCGRDMDMVKVAAQLRKLIIEDAKGIFWRDAQ